MKSAEDTTLKITSRDNPKIKGARLVRDNRNKELVFIEGRRLCAEAARSDLKITDVFFTASFAENNREFFETIGNQNLTEVSEQIFDSLSDTKTAQGVIFIAEKPAGGKQKIEANLNVEPFPLVVVLHKINNPANMGAILRSAEASGVCGIVTTKSTTDVYSAKALRGAMGAALRLPVWTNADYFEVLQWAGEREFTSVCADVGGEKSYTEIDWRTRRLLIVGSEAHGLSKAESAACDESLIIPMQNGVESLNAAVAAGVILFEAQRQRTENEQNNPEF